MKSHSYLIPLVVMFLAASGVWAPLHHPLAHADSTVFSANARTLYNVNIFDNGPCIPTSSPPDCGFDPQSITVGPNSTVTWTNSGPMSIGQDLATCSTANGPPLGACPTMDDPSLPSFDSGGLTVGSWFSFSFTVPGSYYYFSPLHPWMGGTVIVTTSGFNVSVAETLLLSNDTLLSGNVAPFTGHAIDAPTAVAYDSRDNRVFVTNGKSLETLRSTNTVTLIDGNTNKIIRGVPVADPRGIAYDPSNDYLYIASTPGLTILNGSTGAQVANVTLGTAASGVAYDPSNNQIYVADYSTSSVAIVDASTGLVAANVTVGANPTGLAYNPYNQDVYANCLQSGIISVINGSTNQVANMTLIPSFSIVANSRQPTSFQNVAYDATNHNLYFVNYISTIAYADKVFVLNSLSGTIANFTLGEAVGALAYNAANNEMYVTASPSGSGSFFGDSVMAIDPATETQIANITVGYGPLGIAFDPHNQDLYVANSRSASVSVLDSANTVTTTDFLQNYPSSAAYDSVNKILYVTNEGSYAAALYKDSLADNIFAINTTDNSIVPIYTGLVLPTGIVYDSHNGYLYISSNAFNIISVFNPSTNSLVANVTIPFSEIGDLVYDSQDHTILVASQGDCNPRTGSCSGTITAIDDNSNTVIASVNAGAYPLGLAYDPTYDEIFITHYGLLQNSLNDFVTVIQEPANSLVANITVGERPTGVLYDPANGDIYVADSGSSQVSVISDKTNSVIATIPVQISRVESPEGFIYDPVNDEILATNQFPPDFNPLASNLVSVIDGASNNLLGDFTLGYNPTDGVYDPANGYLYVTNYFSGTVSLVASTINGKNPTSLNISCPDSSIQVGTFATCTVTATGESPSGDVILSTTSPTGVFIPPTGSCTLSTAGTCSVTYTDYASSNATAVLSASYQGDAYNTAASGTFSLTIVKLSTILATAASSLTISSGSATADQTSITGVSVQITASTAADGTPAVVDTQYLSSPSTGVGTVNLSGPKYYDVVVGGISTGVAKVRVSYSSATSATTMQYWTGTAWTGAVNVAVNGGTVCGAIPVSALTGTNVAVGNTIQSAPLPPQPTIFGLNPTLFYEILGAVVGAIVIVCAALVVSRRRRNKAPQLINKVSR
jgi:YVTN family beta-propeller protein